MDRRRAGFALAFILTAGLSVAAVQGPPAYTFTGTAPSGSCVGTRVIAEASTGALYCCAAGTWTACGSSGGGAPTTAQYWTGAADGTLSAEKNLGALSTGLVINTAGVPSAYTATSCTLPQVMTGLSAIGSPTCQQPTALAVAPSICSVGSSPRGVDASGNVLACQAIPSVPTGNIWSVAYYNGSGALTFNASPLGTGTPLLSNSSGTPTWGALNLAGVGNVTSTLPQANGGTGAGALTCSATQHLTSNGTAYSCAADPVNVTGTAASLSSSGATNTVLHGNAGAAPTWAGVTATTDFAANQGTSATFLRGNAAGQPSWGTLVAGDIPVASTTIGGVKQAAACAAGNHVSSIVAGELTCSADAGGGAPTGNPWSAAYYNGSGTLTFNATPTGSFLPLLSNTSGAPTWGALPIGGVGVVAGQLPVANGGTAGTATPFAGAVAYGTGSAYAFTSTGTIWQSLHGNGTGAPIWDKSPAYTMLTATWASSAVANTTGIVGTGAAPLTSPVYPAASPFGFRCTVSTARPATTNGPRYGVMATTGSITRISLHTHVALAATTETRTQLIAAMTANCATNCSTAMVTGTLAQVMDDQIEGTGVMNASGTLSLYMAPSAAAANTAQIGSFCVWY
jgi:hypothetical protein